MDKKLRSRLLAIIALLLSFALVFTGCEADDKDDRDRDEREEERDRDDDDDEDDEDDEDEEDGEDEVNEPVYERQTVYLCVRASTEQWDGTGTVVTEYEYDEYGNQTVSRNATYGSYTEYTYDENGNQIGSVYYGADGSAGSTYEKTYDAEGRILSSASVNSEGNPGSTYLYTYDEAGYLIREEQNFHSSGSQYLYTFTYNEDHTEAYIEYYYNGELQSYSVESYDSDGNLLRADGYKPDGSWSGGMVCEYDDQGRLIVEWKYSTSETQSDYEVYYTYDENGLLVFKDVDYYYGSGTTYEYQAFEILVRVK